MPDLPDLTKLDDDALDALRLAVTNEKERRYTLENAANQVEQTAIRYREAVEAALPPLEPGQHRSWVQPTGAHDAYPRNAVVSHNGKLWESANPANVWEPGGAGVPAGLWKDVTKTAPPAQPSPTAPPFKAGENVKVGDLRTYKDVVYKVITAHTTADHWTPDVAPSLWTKA